MNQHFNAHHSNMANALQKKATAKKRGISEEPLKINGSFVDIMNLVVKHM